MLPLTKRQREILDYLNEFIQKHGQTDDKEMYGNFNMGAGFAIYVPKEQAGKVFEVYLNPKNTYPFNLVRAGYVVGSQIKQVIIKPKDIKYVASTLEIR